MYDILSIICIWSCGGWAIVQLLKESWWFCFKAPDRLIVIAIILAGPLVWLEVWQA